MDKNNEKVIKYKILLLGNTQVGKTSMLKRFCDEEYNEDTLSTIGIDAKKKFINHKDRKIQLDIWDTAGQERFLSITKNTYKGSDGIILIYDLTSKKTFYSINNWINGIKEAIDINKIGIVLVGNKSDCNDKRQVNFEEGDNLAKEKGFPFFETSVKENININEVFIAIIDKLFDLEIKLKNEKEGENQKLKKDDKKNDKVKKCCLDKKKNINNDNNNNNNNNNNI